MNTTYDGILGPYLLNYDVFNDVCKAILVNLLSLTQAIILTPVPLNIAMQLLDQRKGAASP